MVVRKAAVAGTFYPGGRKELEEMIGKMMANAKEANAPSKTGTLKALVCPHAGYAYSGKVAAAGYKLLEEMNEKQKPEKIVIVGPSHHAWFPGVAESGASGWETPLGTVEIEKANKIAATPNAAGFFSDRPKAHGPEHCLEVQLPFLQTVLKNGFTACPLLTGDVDTRRLGEWLAEASDRGVFLIASSDLSHFLPQEEANQIDSIANSTIPAVDEEKAQGIDACGKTGVLALVHAARLKKWKGMKVDYATSGDVTGDRGRVVGYGCYAFFG